jgi:hypothetical protein
MGRWVDDLGAAPITAPIRTALAIMSLRAMRSAVENPMATGRQSDQLT